VGTTGAATVNATAEIFVPTTGMFTLTSGAMSQGRSGNTATLLPSSGLVLVTGGIDSGYNGRNSLELFNANAGANGAFSLLSIAMSTTRWIHTADLLPNGKVLLTGGCLDDVDDPCTTTNRAELYDPSVGANGNISATGSLLKSRGGHKSALLPNSSKVLIMGGHDDGANSLASSEIFDPAGGTNGAFSTTGDMNFPRYGHVATVLDNGKVLVTGGWSDTGNLTSAEVYDPGTSKFTLTPGTMNSPHSLGATARLKNGAILVVGGDTAAAELYCP